MGLEFSSFNISHTVRPTQVPQWLSTIAPVRDLRMSLCQSYKPDRYGIRRLYMRYVTRRAEDRQCVHRVMVKLYGLRCVWDDRTKLASIRGFTTTYRLTEGSQVLYRHLYLMCKRGSSTEAHLISRHESRQDRILGDWICNRASKGAARTDESMERAPGQC